MFQFELKRIVSKKINLFVIGVVLLLAVIFSGFAVTSNRYVDENGMVYTGILATRMLAENKAPWRGVLMEETLAQSFCKIEIRRNSIRKKT